MKTHFSLQTMRRALHDSLPCVCLWVLAAGLPAAVLGQANYSTPYTFTTLAGRNGEGSADGTNSAARFSNPYGVAVDTNGNVYAADFLNCTIRKITPIGTDRVVTTLAGLAGVSGTNDGTGIAARFYHPSGVAADNAGNLYVSDLHNDTIRKMTPVGTNWVVTTLAGLGGVPGSANGTGSAARFYHPSAVAVDGVGNVYVTDGLNETIRKVTPAGAVTTLAGMVGVSGSADGTNSAARFDLAYGLAVDSAGNLYVADQNNNTVRKVTPLGANWVVTTLAGQAGVSGSADGTGTKARFYYPDGIAVDSAGNVYVADQNNNTVRQLRWDGTNWVVTTLAGRAGSSGFVDGTGSAARFFVPTGMAVDSTGNVYVGDTYNNAVREVTPAGVVTTLAGGATGGGGSPDGTGSAARFNFPLGAAVDTNGNVYTADLEGNTIRQVTPAGVVTTLAGQTGVAGSGDGTGTNALFNGPCGPAVDSAGSVYVADWGNHTIRKVTPVGTNWVVTTLAGKAGHPGLLNGMGTNAEFDYPNGVAVDTNGNVYVADTANAAIRKVTPAGAVTTLSTDFSGPTGAAVGSNGTVYVADYYSYTIRKVTPGGAVTILAGLADSPGSADGTNTTARFNYPNYVAVDTAGNVYVADSGNDTVRKVTPAGANWVVTTLAGVAGNSAYADGTGTNALFAGARGVAVDSAGDVYVADANNNAIRKGFPASSVPAPVLQPPSLSAGQFSFGITGLPNLAVDIESSGDFSEWQVIGTSILEGGTNYFVSPFPPQGAQFYRAQVR